MADEQTQAVEEQKPETQASSGDQALDPKLHEIISKKNQENASLRRRMKEYETKAQSLEGIVTTLKNAFEVEDDVDLDEAIRTAAEVRKLQQKPSQEDSRLKTLERQLSRMQKDTEDWKKKYEEAETRGKRERIRTVLSGEFSKQNAELAGLEDFILDGLVQSGRVIMNDSGSIVWIENDEEYGLPEGVKKFLASRPQIVRGSGRQGTGTQSGAPSIQIDDLMKSLPDMSAETWEKQGRSQFIAALKARTQ